MPRATSDATCLLHCGRALRTFPAALLTGARQTGKTTLLRHEFGETHRYVALDRPDVRAMARADPLGFLADNPPPAILDEIQHAPELLSYLKERIDADRRPAQWLLSGSQSFPLMRGVTETLAGRVAILTLDPLSCSEVAGRAPLPVLDDLLERVFSGAGETSPGVTGVDLADWILRGGYPELRTEPAVDKTIWLASYVQTYLERDVRDLVQVGDLETFGRFLGLLAARNGGLLNLSELGRDAGTSHSTARRWLGVLSASRVVFLLSPYHRNLGKRLVKSPRVHFADTAVAAFLQGVHTRELALGGPSAGALVETAVAGEWVKAFHAGGEESALSFWSAHAGPEVDLVIDRGGRLHGIEVKATATPTPAHAEGLARWLELAGPTARGVLACRIESPRALRPRIRAVPWHLAWAHPASGATD